MFCADGTWDTVSSLTNVYRLYCSLLVSSAQVPLYDDGVGADCGDFTKLLDGAFGFGLFQKIKDGYSGVAHLYEPGDEIFLFGFSRGAYTARSLAGMIAACGLPAGALDSGMTDDAFAAYRDPAQRAAFRARYQPHAAAIRMIGVWDTVGALGVPAIFGGVSPLLFGFLDTNLHPDIACAFQALALDERRSEFTPTLWTNPPAPGQIIEQVWFSGAHSDVGGGYGIPSLADITLAWMMDHAARLGAAFDPSALQRALRLRPAACLEPVHGSWSPEWGIPCSRNVAAGSRLAQSIADRCRWDPAYRPPNLRLDPAGQPVGYALTPVLATA